MTESYTPGPWHRLGGIIYAQRNPGGIKTQIAECFRDAGYDHCRGNARLIAAAPELLEACKEAVFYLRNLPSLPRTNPVADKIESAIAKAEKGGAL